MKNDYDYFHHFDTIGPTEAEQTEMVLFSDINVGDRKKAQIDLTYGNGQYGKAIHLKTSGHVDDYGGNIEISMRRFEMAPEPTEPA